jgi:hypothetical protein
MRWRAAAAVVALSALAGMAAACGVPNDGEPRGIASRDVPAGLLAPSTTQSFVPDVTGPVTTPTTEVPDAPPIKVFLAITGQNRVYLVERRGDPPTDDVLQSAQDAADVLLQSPLALERQAGYTTALTTTTIKCLRVSADGVLDVEVAQLPRAIADQPLAMAQIVLTLVRVNGVTKLRFFRDGDLVSVPLWVGGETQPDETVDASDYFGAIGSAPTPQVPSTTTTTTTTAPVATTTTAVVETTAPAPAEQTPSSEPAPPAEGG